MLYVFAWPFIEPEEPLVRREMAPCMQPPEYPLPPPPPLKKEIEEDEDGKEDDEDEEFPLPPPK